MSNFKLKFTDDMHIPLLLKISPFTLKPFKTVTLKNVSNAICDDILSIGLFQKEKLLFHASFSDKIIGITLDSDDWVKFLTTCAGRKRFTCLNTLFVQTFCGKDEYKVYSKEIVIEVFKTSPFIKYVIFFSHVDEEVDYSLFSLFTPKNMKFKNYTLWLCKRKTIIPIKLRDVKLEDFDDIRRLTEKQRNILQRVYGKNYPVDIAQYTDEYTYTAVATSNEKVVGFFYASPAQINLNELNSNFQLEPFYGLRKQNPGDKKTIPSDMIKKTWEKFKDSDDDESFSSSVMMSKLHLRQSAYISGFKDRQNWRLIKEQYGFHPSDDPYKSIFKIPLQIADEDEDLMLDEENQLNWPKEHLLPIIPEYQPIPIPSYKGSMNCFEIYFCSMEKKYESECFSFLKGAFKKLNHFEYCIALLPFGYPLLSLHQHFFQVPLRPLSQFPQTLFVFHKASVTCDFEVRECIKKDFPYIKRLVEPLYSKNYVLWDVKEFLMPINKKNSIFFVTVATCLNNIVGVAVVKLKAKLDYISSHYDIDNNILNNSQKYGTLRHCILNPSLKSMSKIFLRETIRLSMKSVLFYHVYPPHVPFSDSLWQSGCNIFTDLFPLKSLISIRYNFANLSLPPKEMYEIGKKFSTHFINKKLTFYQKNVITSRLLVIGASEVALSFLKSLIYDSGMLFTNIFLISPYGFPGEYPLDTNRNTFLPESIYYNNEALDCLCLHSYINIIYGKMATIHRSEKVIILNNGAKLAYDYLILTCGLQYQRSLQSEVLLNEEYDDGHINSEIEENPSESDNHPTPQQTCIKISKKTLLRTAQNLFAVNDVFDAAVVLKWLGKDFKVTTGKLIVYGNSIEAYSCIAGILNANVTGNNIIFAKCVRSKAFPVFRNLRLEAKLKVIMKNLKITIYENATLDINEITEIVSSVTIISNDSEITESCRALFICDEKKVDYITYNALFRANLHFDGRLSTDSTFKTNDKYIYAAGTHTKFWKQYYANHFDNVKLNSNEVGEILSRNIQQVLFEDNVKTNHTFQLPTFTQPVITSSKLPGGYKYLLVEKPRFKYDELNFPSKKKVEHSSTKFDPFRIVISNIEKNIRFKTKIYYGDAYDEKKKSPGIGLELNCEKIYPGNPMTESPYDIREFEKQVQNYEFDNEMHVSKFNEKISKIICDSAKSNKDTNTQKTRYRSNLKNYEFIDDFKHFYHSKLSSNNKERLSVKPQNKPVTSRRKIEKDESFSDFNTEEHSFKHFALEFNEFCEVESITCFAKNFESRNLVKLYGMHYSFFNFLFEKLGDMSPSDIFNFFQEPWSTALYHDCFNKFRENLREYSPNIKPLNNSEKELYKSCKRHLYEEFINEKLQEFINQYSSSFPMY